MTQAKEILSKHYFNYYSDSFPADRLESVVDMALGIKEETDTILAAMQEYADLKTKELQQERDRFKLLFFKSAYAQYWEHVEKSVDPEGWCYSNETPHLLDYYFEANTKKPIEFEKSYPGEWRGTRWRPKEITEALASWKEETKEVSNG